MYVKTRENSVCIVFSDIIYTQINTKIIVFCPPQMSPLLILFVFVMPKMSPQTSSQVSSLHKKSGVHNRSNRFEPRHYRISRLNTT